MKKRKYHFNVTARILTCDTLEISPPFIVSPTESLGQISLACCLDYKVVCSGEV